jgi:hypothetical protein
MGAGFAQVGVLLLLTVVGLPLFFFGLMAALDKFERSFSPQPRMAATPPSEPTGAEVAPAPVSTPAGSPAAAPALAPEATVVALPSLPVAAASSAPAASKPAAAI